MGWKLKLVAGLAGLAIFPGSPPLSVLLLLYATSGIWLNAFRRRRGRMNVKVTLQSPQAPAVRFGKQGHLVRRSVGVVFLLLSLVAVIEGGTFSPLVFGAIGAVLLFWGTALWEGTIGSLRPVKGSVILKSRFDLIHWFAVAEVKLTTKQAGRALGGVNGRLIVAPSGSGDALFVVLKATALTLKGAEDSLMSRLSEIARTSGPLGAYLLPLDPRAVDGILGSSLEPIKLDPRGWPADISTADFAVLAIEARRGFVNSVGAYRLLGEAGGRVSLPRARQVLSRPSLLWEALQELGKKVEWAGPDAYTTFLASMMATRGETIGERVSEAGSSDTNQVLVQSLGTPPVSLTRAQLRAIARIYP